MTKDEMIKQLLMQVNSLTMALNSLQQSFDAQTALIAQLNQTIQELKERLNKTPKTVPNHHQVTGSKSLRQKVYANLPERRLAGRTDIKEHIWLSFLIRMRL